MIFPDEANRVRNRGPSVTSVFSASWWRDGVKKIFFFSGHVPKSRTPPQRLKNIYVFARCLQSRGLAPLSFRTYPLNVFFTPSRSAGVRTVVYSPSFMIIISIIQSSIHSSHLVTYSNQGLQFNFFISFLSSFP